MSEQASSAPSQDSWLRRFRVPIMIGVPLIIVIAGAWIWITGGRYVATDDAYIGVGRVQISANASGHVVELAVHENQRVRKGDLLFRLDPATPLVQIDQAAAQLGSVEAQVEGYRAAYRQGQAELALAQANLAFRQKELARERGLASQGVVSKEEADAAQHEADVAAQQLAAARERLGVTAANLGGGLNVPADQIPLVKQAHAQLERARLSQSDTIVRAPQDGVVTKVSQLQVGSYVQAASPVFTLVTDELWVDANFKESDLTYMRAGQHAKITIDAYKDHDLDAVVQSLSPGTGSSFSILPPENATGNWVKVVQRVPVRLTFTRRPDIPLQGGLSANVSVDTQHRRVGGSAPRP